MYIPDRDRSRNPNRDQKPPSTTHAIESMLETELAQREREDDLGAEALAAVVAICNGKPLSSCRAVTLRKLGKGWSTERPCNSLAYLVAPTGQRVHIPSGILDAEAILKSNTCWTVGAQERKRKVAHTRQRILAIAHCIMDAVSAQIRLHALLKGASLDDAVSYVEYTPWRIMDRMLEAVP